MRANLRATVLSAIVCAVALIGSLPAFADTSCACDNGENVTTTREDAGACDDACELLGGGGHVATSDDEDNGDDSTVVVPRPRRDRSGPASPRRR